MIRYYDGKTFDTTLKKEKDWTCDKELNPYITETAGFIPLDVQIQKFEQAGIRAKFRSDMFDSSDYRDMYMHPDLRINSEDDEIDVENKLRYQDYIRKRILMDKARAGQRQSFEDMSEDYRRMRRSEADEHKPGSGENIPKPPAAGAES